jgi:uncharacterized protein with von Willebrand factor type A (vWA) domain
MSYDNADIWAAAVSLAFLEIAYSQKRPVAFVHFGSTVLRTDIFTDWNNIDRAKVLESVSFFASAGGTNFVEPLSKGIEIIRDTGSFTDADIIMITDGKCFIPDEFLVQWGKDKSNLGFNCYSILVGNDADKSVNEQFSDDTTHLASTLQNDKAMHKYFKFI